MINSVIKKILSDYLQVEISMSDNLVTDLKCDYENVIVVLEMIDARFDIDLTFDENLQVNTVEDLCAGVRKLTKYKNITLH